MTCYDPDDQTVSHYGGDDDHREGQGPEEVHVGPGGGAGGEGAETDVWDISFPSVGYAEVHHSIILSKFNSISSFNCWKYRNYICLSYLQL